MASHLSSIGLPVDSEIEFWELAQRVGPVATPYAVPGGDYFHWHDSSGAELWLQVADGDQFLGMAPHFAGDSAVPARLEFRIPSADGSPLDGAFRATTLTDPEVPFVFDSPDFLRHESLELPLDVTLNLAAFAHELELFDSAEEFDAAQLANKEALHPTLTARHFAQSQRLNDGPDALAESRIVLSGVVMSSAECVNGLTGRCFTWAVVDCGVGTVDVVADRALLPLPPLVGAVLSGTFWLSGRVT